MQPRLLRTLSLIALLYAPALIAQTHTAVAPLYIQRTSGVDNIAIGRAFAEQRSDIQVSGRGTVFKLLPDDNHGSRHQKFLIRLSSGLTLLIAHNIDLAPRVEQLKAGDSIEFYGEYEWNEQGGVVHWTHRDPKGRHLAGWLKHKGKTIN